MLEQMIGHKMNILNNRVFQDLDEEEKKIVSQYIQIEEYKKGKFIVQIGEKNSDLFIVLKGEVEAVSELTDIGLVHIHNIFGRNELFGELAFLTNAPRTLNIVSKNKTIVGRLSSQIIKDYPDILLKIQPYLLDKTLTYINSTNQKQINFFKNELKLLKIKKYQNQILIFLIFDFSIALMVNHLISQLGFDIYSSIFAGIYLLFIVLPLGIIMLYNKLPLNMIGVSRRNLGKSIKEGFLITLVLCSLIIVAYFTFLPKNETHLTLPQIIMSLFEPRTYLVYLYHVTLQQFIRTYFQNSIHIMFEDKFFPSAFLSSYCFSLLHIHLGVLPVVITFFAGMIFAYLYYRHQNIWGIIIIQFFTGTLMFNLEIF